MCRPSEEAVGSRQILPRGGRHGRLTIGIIFAVKLGSVSRNPGAVQRSRSSAPASTSSFGGAEDRRATRPKSLLWLCARIPRAFITAADFTAELSWDRGEPIFH